MHTTVIRHVSSLPSLASLQFGGKIGDNNNRIAQSFFFFFFLVGRIGNTSFSSQNFHISLVFFTRVQFVYSLVILLSHIPSDSHMSSPTRPASRNMVFGPVQTGQSPVSERPVWDCRLGAIMAPPCHSLRTGSGTGLDLLYLKDSLDTDCVA